MCREQFVANNAIDIPNMKFRNILRCKEKPFSSIAAAKATGKGKGLYLDVQCCRETGAIYH